jgi:HAD superfamily hydrolase (TIGR01509 family)
MLRSDRPWPDSGRHRPPEAVTTDFWFTLCYLPAAARRRVERERFETWADPLEVAGLSRATVRRHLRALAAWTDAEERRGRAPSIGRQSIWLARRSGVALDANVVTRRLEASLRGSPIRAAPGVREALAQLRDRGLRLGLISNLVNESAAVAEVILQELGLDRFYSSRVFSSDLPWSKPDPRPFRRCLDALGVDPAASVHVGDRAIDRVGARRAGMRAIVYTGLHRAEFGRTVPRVERPPSGTPRAASWREVVRLIGRGPT